jgi:hypothetical protein
VVAIPSRELEFKNIARGRLQVREVVRINPLPCLSYGAVGLFYRH